MNHDEFEHAYDTGYRRGYSDGRRSVTQVKNGKAQRVLVRPDDGGIVLTYGWEGDPRLELGDRVEMPAPSWYSSPTWVGTVVGLGSDYKGIPIGILAVLERAAHG